nr:hypothetical protein [Marinicella sp. W31]MDC2876500.1 hypothetical protein [Marinicella sp. W31]
MLFAVALMATDLGFIIMFLQPFLPDAFARIAGNIVFVAAQVSFGEALLQRRGKTLGWPFILGSFSGFRRSMSYSMRQRRSKFARPALISA